MLGLISKTVDRLLCYKLACLRVRRMAYTVKLLKQIQLECGPMPNMMAALLNIGGALCSTPQFGWRLLLECRAVTLPRRETRWNLQGCPKLANRSQPLVGRCSPLLSGHMEEVLIFNKFCSDCRHMPYFRRYSSTKLCDGAKMAACSTFHTCILNSH